MRELPPFATGRRWRRRFSNAVGRNVYYDPVDGYEYERVRHGHRHAWHRIDPRSRQYQDIDDETGSPIAGSEGRWRVLR